VSGMTCDFITTPVFLSLGPPEVPAPPIVVPHTSYPTNLSGQRYRTIL